MAETLEEEGQQSGTQAEATGEETVPAVCMIRAHLDTNGNPHYRMEGPTIALMGLLELLSERLKFDQRHAWAVAAQEAAKQRVVPVHPGAVQAMRRH